MKWFHRKESKLHRCKLPRWRLARWENHLWFCPECPRIWHAHVVGGGTDFGHVWQVVVDELGSINIEHGEDCAFGWLRRAMQ